MAALLAALVLFPAHAGAVADDPPDPDETITFEPAFLHVSAQPGERVTTSVLLKNQTRVVPTFSSEVFDMVAGPGASTAFDYVPTGEAPRGAGPWITAVDADALSIPAGEERRVSIVVDVPEDAGAGGHFGAVVFRAPDPRRTSAVRLEISVPVPVFVTVSGDYEHDLRARVRPVDRVRWSGGRVAWEVELRNEGDVHEPFGARLRIDGLLDGAQARDLSPGILLPGERRTQRVTFDLRSAPDLVTARLRVVSETGPGGSDDAPRLFVLPIWILVLLATAIGVASWRIRTRERRFGAARDDDDGWSDDEIDVAG